MVTVIVFSRAKDSPKRLWLCLMLNCENNPGLFLLSRVDRLFFAANIAVGLADPIVSPTPTAGRISPDNYCNTLALPLAWTTPWT